MPERLRKMRDIAKRNPANLLHPSTPVPTASEQYARIRQDHGSNKRPRLGWRTRQGVDPFDDVFISPVERGEAHELAVERGEGYFDDKGVYHEISDDILKQVDDNPFAVLDQENVEYFVHSLGPNSPMMSEFEKSLKDELGRHPLEEKVDSLAELIILIVSSNLSFPVDRDPLADAFSGVLEDTLIKWVWDQVTAVCLAYNAPAYCFDNVKPPNTNLMPDSKPVEPVSPPPTAPSTPQSTDEFDWDIIEKDELEVVTRDGGLEGKSVNNLSSLFGLFAKGK